MALVTRLLRRKFASRPDLDQTLLQLAALPVEKLEDMAEAILDWSALEDFTAWLKEHHGSWQ